MLTRISRWALALAMVLSLALMSPARAGEPAQGAEEDLGYPIATQVLSPESSLGVDDGDLLAFYVTNGNEEVTAMLQVVDVEAGETIFQQRLPEGINSWANAFSDVDGRVYFATTDGHLYSWKSGEEEVTQHDFPLADDGEGIWRLAVAPDGTVYGGTYPGGLLFSYDPESDDITNHGQVNEGETYVRSLAVDDEYVYAGSQPNAKLVRWDRETGETTELPMPEGVSGQSAMYDLTVTDELLFARVEPLNTLIVYDLEDLSVVNVVPKITGRVISSPDPTGSYVYFRMNNGVDPAAIYEYDMETHTMRSFGWGPNIFPGAFAFHEFDDQERFPGYTIVATYYRGRTYAFNQTSREGLYIGEQVLEPTPNPIQAIGAGPDGKIYVPGFLSPPGIAQFDPATDTTELLAGAGQVEGIGSFDDLLLLGRYPNGQLTAYDTTEPWAYGTNPPEPFGIGEEQDRPQSFVRVGDEVAVSSVPKSGRLGGALTMWDPLSGETRVHTNLVDKQSPVSLVESDGLIWAGTSINGGYGIDPVAPEAKLVAVDPATGEVVFETVPLPGAMTVSGLEVAADGRIWGIADGALFEFDPEAREMIAIEQTFPETRTMYGTPNEIEFGADGHLYATSAGALWRVDMETRERVRLAHGGVKYLAQDDDGDLYYARVAKLYRWDFDTESAIDGTAPVTEATVLNDGGTPDEVSVTLDATDDGGAGVERTEYRIGDGGWTTYEEPIAFDEPGSYVVGFRSVDKDQNVEGAKQVEVEVVAGEQPSGVSVNSAGTRLVGSATNVWGSAPGLEGEPIVAEALADDEWVPAGEGTVGADGGYVVALGDAVAAAGEYRLRVRVGEAVSEEVELVRLARTGFGASPVAVTGRTASVWGTVAGEARVSTQVLVPGKGWSTSQAAEAGEDGWFQVPLTYGAGSAGEFRWRVVVEHAHGEREVLPVFTQRRVAPPSATSAGTAPIGRDTNVWGTAAGASRVWSEVQLPDGRWVRSQAGSPDVRGGYVIPLTYGQHAPGTYRWRVAAHHDGIGTLHSAAFTLTRR